jgi:hypothetical protein
MQQEGFGLCKKEKYYYRTVGMFFKNKIRANSRLENLKVGR